MGTSRTKSRVASATLQRWRKAFGDRFFEFANLSQVQGFYFIVTSRCRLEQVMWAVLLLACISLTVKDSVELINKYADEKTVIEVELRTRESLDFLPLPEICIRLKTNDIIWTSDFKTPVANWSIDWGIRWTPLDPVYDALARSNSVQVLLESLSNESDIIGYLRSDERDTIWAYQWNKSASADNTSIYYMYNPCKTGYCYLPVGRKRALFEVSVLMLILAERKYEDHTNDTNPKPDTDIYIRRLDGLRFMRADGFLESMRLLHDFYAIQRNVTIVDVMKATGRLVCQMTQVLVPDYEVTKAYCTYPAITFAGHDPNVYQEPFVPIEFHVCSRPPGAASSNQTVKTLRVLHSPEFVQPSVPGYIVIVNFGMPEANSLEMRSEFIIEPTLPSPTVVINTVVEFTRRPTRSRPCVERRPWSCTLDALFDGQYRECGCYPLAWLRFHHRSDSVRVCADIGALNDSENARLTDCYYKWQIKRTQSYIDQTMDDRCVQACRTTLLSMTRDSREDGKDDGFGESPGRSARFVAAPTAFPSFSERPEMTSQDFVSQLGGVLGLYIGASFMAIYHFFVFLARVALDYCEERRLKSKSVKAAPNASSGRLVAAGHAVSMTTLPKQRKQGPSKTAKLRAGVRVKQHLMRPLKAGTERLGNTKSKPWRKIMEANMTAMRDDLSQALQEISTLRHQTTLPTTNRRSS